MYVKTTTQAPAIPFHYDVLMFGTVSNCWPILNLILLWCFSLSFPLVQKYRSWPRPPSAHIYKRVNHYKWKQGGKKETHGKGDSLQLGLHNQPVFHRCNTKTHHKTVRSIFATPDRIYLHFTVPANILMIITEHVSAVYHNEMWGKWL